MASSEDCYHNDPYITEPALLNNLLPPVEQAYLPNCKVRLLVKQTEFRALEPAFLPARER